MKGKGWCSETACVSLGLGGRAPPKSLGRILYLNSSKRSPGTMLDNPSLPPICLKNFSVYSDTVPRML